MKKRNSQKGEIEVPGVSFIVFLAVIIVMFIIPSAYPSNPEYFMYGLMGLVVLIFLGILFGN